MGGAESFALESRKKALTKYGTSSDPFQVELAL